MKQNLLKILLLASTVTMSLCGCDDKKQSESTSNEISSGLESDTGTSSNSSEASNSSSATERPDVIIELSKYVFLEGESALTYVSRFDQWSNALGDYKDNLKSTFSVIMPDECPNGDATLIIKLGNKNYNVPIKYFKTAEDAAKNIKIDIPANASDYFDEEAYIKDGQLKFEYKELEDGMMVKRGYTSAMNINKESTSMEWSTQTIEVWQYDSLTGEDNVGHYDNTQRTIGHYIDKVTDPTHPIHYYNSSYLPKANNFSNTADIYNFEFITDGQGKLLYVGPINYTSGTWPRPNQDTGYWSCIKDYNSNPVFTFAPDYDPEDTAKVDNYQKVLPNGGTWFIGYNNLQRTVAGVDELWHLLTGTVGTIQSQESTIQLTMKDESVEERLMNSRVFYEGGRKKAITVYGAADVFERYASCYAKSLASGDEEKIALREEVYNAILLSQLPEVQKEEVLASYYTNEVAKLIEEWEKKLA